MAEIKIILPGAWEVTEDISSKISKISDKLFSLKVPSQWQQVAKSLAEQRVKVLGRGYPSVPVYSLDPIIAASFPQIIKTVRNGWQKSNIPWIFSTEKADLSLLPEIIKDWLREEFYPSLGEEEVERCLNNLNDNNWTWDDSENNTLQEQLSNIDFQAIPDYLATKFLENNTVTFGKDNQYELNFYRVVKLQQGAELMSWPPTQVTTKKEVEYISFVISFSLQTIPWRKQAIIYHQLSIRRWITKKLNKFPYKGATVYVGDIRRWLDGQRQPFSFIPLQLKRRGEKVGFPRAISELLKMTDSPLPDPENLRQNLQYHWSILGQEPDKLQATISYDTRHSVKHSCLPGVSPLDLASLDNTIQARLDLKRVGEAEKVKGKTVYFWGKVESKKKGEQKDTNDLSTPMLRPSLAQSAVFSAYNNLTILIVWETEKCRNALIDEICQLLSLSKIGETKTQQINNSEVTETLYQSFRVSVCMKTQHVSDLTQNFDIKGKNKRPQRVELMEERINKIKSFLLPLTKGGSGGVNSTKTIAGAIVEIKEPPFIPENDPKLAWRIGARQAGYLNQHIHKLTKINQKGEEYLIKGAENRVKSAVSDLFRQFGILPTPLIKPEIDKIEPNIWLTCVYILRRTRKTTANNKANTVGLMLRVNPITGKVELTTPSLFYEHKKQWLEYPEALLYLLTEKWDPESCFEEQNNENETASNDNKQEQQAFNKFVSDCLRDCLNTPIEAEKKPRVLFMAEAQNARKLLSWLKNPDLPAGKLPNELGLNDREKERLWIVRLRKADNREVPVAIAKNSPGSRVSAGGVFTWQNVCDDSQQLIYLSHRKLANTEQGLLTIGESRLDNGSKQAGSVQLLEIAVVYHPGIEQDKLAFFVHSLRHRWPYFADHVALPFPFPFAIKAKEYAVGARDEIDLEEWSEEEPEEEEDSSETAENIQLSLFDVNEF